MSKLRLGLDLELAWAAGFFDGEGHVGCHKHSMKYGNQQYRLALSIAQVDREVLDRFREAVGVGTVRGPYEHGKNRIKYFMFNCQSESNVKDLYQKLHPYLSSVKNSQFIQALDKLENWKKGQHERHVSAGKKAMAVRWHNDVAQFPKKEVMIEVE